MTARSGFFFKKKTKQRVFGIAGMSKLNGEFSGKCAHDELNDTAPSEDLCGGSRNEVRAHRYTNFPARS